MKYYDKGIEEMAKGKVNLLIERGYIVGSPDEESTTKA